MQDDRTLSLYKFKCSNKIYILWESCSRGTQQAAGVAAQPSQVQVNTQTRLLQWTVQGSQSMIVLLGTLSALATTANAYQDTGSQPVSKGHATTDTCAVALVLIIILNDNLVHEKWVHARYNLDLMCACVKKYPWFWMRSIITSVTAGHCSSSKTLQ